MICSHLLCRNWCDSMLDHLVLCSYFTPPPTACLQFTMKTYEDNHSILTFPKGLRKNSVMGKAANNSHLSKFSYKKSSLPFELQGKLISIKILIYEILNKDPLNLLIFLRRFKRTGELNATTKSKFSLKFFGKGL